MGYFFFTDTFTLSFVELSPGALSCYGNTLPLKYIPLLQLLLNLQNKMDLRTRLSDTERILKWFGY